MSLLSFTKKIAGRDIKKKPKKAAAKKETKAATSEASIQPATSFSRVELLPMITEKSVSQQGSNNTVAFRTRPNVSKGQIAAVVLARYGVAPVSVRTMQMMPKRRTRGKTSGQTNAWKKAYVTLPAGKTIDFSV